MGQIKSVTSRPLPRRRYNIIFDPKKTIIFLIEKDVIPRVIGGLDSDITFEKISRSSTYCFEEFFVQLPDERMVDSAFAKWFSELFDKSSARRVIRQGDNVTESTGVIKGVPFCTSDEILCNGLEDGGFSVEHQ